MKTLARVSLYNHQKQLVEEGDRYRNNLYTVGLGLGKTDISLTRAEKLTTAEPNLKVLVLCQASKIEDWRQKCRLYSISFLVMSIDTAPRRETQLKKMFPDNEFILIVDESQMIKTMSAKRTKFVLNLLPKYKILLSGTPFNKWEESISHLILLGHPITKKDFMNKYCKWTLESFGGKLSRPFQKIVGYQNIDELKSLFRNLGQITMSYDDALLMSPELENIPPVEALQIITVPPIPEYKQFKKDKIITIKSGKDEIEIMGDTIMAQRHGERHLTSSYNKNKLSALADLVESTEDRIVIFYQYHESFMRMADALKSLNRPTSIINGQIKTRQKFDENENGIIFVQYQAGARGLDLYQARHTVYFELTDSFELYDQSFGRTHRIGQQRTCFYYLLECENSIDGAIKAALDNGKDFNDDMYKKYIASESV